MNRFAHLLIKDIKLGIKDVFILLELGFAVVLVLTLMFLVPEDFQREGRAYIYDSTKVLESFVLTNMPDVEKTRGEFYVDSREAVVDGMTEDHSAIGLIISTGSAHKYRVEVLTQPYTHRALVEYLDVEMEDLLSMLKPPSGVYPAEVYESVRVTSLTKGLRDDIPFNQRLLPPILLYMVGFLGLFAMVSLIGQERIDQTIRARRLPALFTSMSGRPLVAWAWGIMAPAAATSATFAPVSTGLRMFLLSKHATIVATGVCTFTIIYVPMMGSSGYLTCLLVILLTIIMGSSIGVALAAFYDTPMAAMGWVLLLLLLLGLPGVSLFMPTFSPGWLEFIPSHHSLFALDAAMFPDDNAHIVRRGATILGLVSGVLFIASGALFTSRIGNEA